MISPKFNEANYFLEIIELTYLVSTEVIRH